jgi:hypothetical protein
VFDISPEIAAELGIMGLKRLSIIPDSDTFSVCGFSPKSASIRSSKNPHTSTRMDLQFSTFVAGTRTT